VLDGEGMMAREDVPAVSVVIACLNASRTISGQLEALAAQAWSSPWEVIVADNGSSDDSRVVVERFRDRLPALRIVDASGKRGQPYALNVGAREARGAALAFCDADDEVGEGWLPAIGEALAHHEFVACRGDAEKLNDPWVLETRELDPWVLPTLWFPPHLPYAGSGGLGVRRSVHQRAGGFDEALLRLFDVEFCARLALQGYGLVHVPEAVVHIRFRHRWPEIFVQARGYAEYGACLQKRLKPPGSRFPGKVKWIVSGTRPLLRTLGQIRRRGSRAKIAWLLGWQVGRFRGSLRYRVLAV
jgi:glycosyltransferase involved in cell wall biosynthesis